MSIIPVDGMRQLKVGDKVEYRSGTGKSRVEALAEVAHQPGTWSVSLRLLEIRDRGVDVQKRGGEKVLARAGEIFTLQYPSEEEPLEHQIATYLHSRLCRDVFCNWQSATWAQPDKSRTRYLQMAREVIEEVEGNARKAWKLAIERAP